MLYFSEEEAKDLDEDVKKRVKALTDFTNILSSVPNSLKRGLSGKKLAKEFISGAQLLEKYPKRELLTSTLAILSNCQNSLKQDLSGEELVKEVIDFTEVFEKYFAEGTLD